MTDLNNFAEEIEFSKTLIKEAGSLALTYFNTSLTLSFKNDNSVVTQADHAVEKLIRDSLKKAFPNYGFIGEETPEDIQEISWIVDPIDGTVAFSRGLDEFGIALALKNKDEIEFSFIYIPVKNELYFAQKDKGAYLNNEKIIVSNELQLSNSILTFKKDTLYTYFKEFQGFSNNNFRLRVTHAATTESCYLASGKIDGLVKFNQPIWDIAPEYLIMKEAGARITDKYGDNLILLFSKEGRHDYIATTKTLKESDIEFLYFQK